MIAPLEWLPHVSGEIGEANSPNQTAAGDIVSAVMAHYNLAAALPPQTLNMNEGPVGGRSLPFGQALDLYVDTKRLSAFNAETGLRVEIASERPNS